MSSWSATTSMNSLTCSSLPLTNTSIGEVSLPSKRSLNISLATLAGESAGSTRSSDWPNTTELESENRDARNKRPTNKTGSGRRIVKRAIFSQAPVSFGAKSRFISLMLLTLSPKRFSIAGTATAAPKIAKITTATPASAKDCRKYCGKNTIETKTRATVRPENSTVLPADATVFETEVATSLPAARSSRKRFTTKRL